MNSSRRRHAWHWTRYASLVLAAGFALAGVGVQAQARASTCLDPFTPAGVRHGLSPHLLAAIAKVESKMSPFALNLDGRTVVPEDRHDAIRAALGARRNADVGLMQISLIHWREKLGLNVYRLLDPEFNVEIGARILAEARQRSRSLREAIGRYHSARKEKGEEYAQKVLEEWNRKPDLRVCVD